MTNKRLIVLAVSFTAALGAGYWFLSKPITYRPKPATQAEPVSSVQKQAVIAVKKESPSPPKTPEIPSRDKTIQQSDEAFEPMVVQSLLQEVKVDEHNNLVLDDSARRQLDRAMLMLGKERSRLAMNLIEQMIKSGLPGDAGEQAAALFANYYDYKKAEAELAVAAQTSSLEDSRKMLDQLSQLRQSYLGPNVAQALFAEEEAYLRNMIAQMEEAERSAVN